MRNQPSTIAISTRSSFFSPHSPKKTSFPNLSISPQRLSPFHHESAVAPSVESIATSCVYSSPSWPSGVASMSENHQKLNVLPPADFQIQSSARSIMSVSFGDARLTAEFFAPTPAIQANDNQNTQEAIRAPSAIPSYQEKNKQSSSSSSRNSSQRLEIQEQQEHDRSFSVGQESHINRQMMIRQQPELNPGASMRRTVFPMLPKAKSLPRLSEIDLDSRWCCSNSSSKRSLDFSNPSNQSFSISRSQSSASAQIPFLPESSRTPNIVFRKSNFNNVNSNQNRIILEPSNQQFESQEFRSIKLTSVNRNALGNNQNRGNQIIDSSSKQGTITFDLVKCISQKQQQQEKPELKNLCLQKEGEAVAVCRKDRRKGEFDLASIASIFPSQIQSRSMVLNSKNARVSNNQNNGSGSSSSSSCSSKQKEKMSKYYKATGRIFHASEKQGFTRLSFFGSAAASRTPSLATTTTMATSTTTTTTTTGTNRADGHDKTGGIFEQTRCYPKHVYNNNSEGQDVNILEQSMVIDQCDEHLKPRNEFLLNYRNARLSSDRTDKTLLKNRLQIAVPNSMDLFVRDANLEDSHSKRSSSSILIASSTRREHRHRVFHYEASPSANVSRSATRDGEITHIQNSERTLLINRFNQTKDISMARITQNKQKPAYNKLQLAKEGKQPSQLIEESLRESRTAETMKSQAKSFLQRKPQENILNRIFFHNSQNSHQSLSSRNQESLESIP